MTKLLIKKFKKHLFSQIRLIDAINNNKKHVYMINLIGKNIIKIKFEELINDI
jgi:hypothetical protein